MYIDYRGLLSIAFLALIIPSTLAKQKVDLQWAICDKDAETVLRKLGEAGVPPHKANNITYYDINPPVYTAVGLGFRTKVRKHHPISLIKARFGEENEDVPIEADCVWDQYGNATFFTCGLPSPLNDQAEERWSADQVAFAERYQDVDWNGLVPYGPFLNPKWKLRMEGHKAVFDDVRVPTAGSMLHIMEVEVKVKRSKSKKVHKAITKYLEDHGVVICKPVQLPKTLRLFKALYDGSTAASVDEQVIMGSRSYIMQSWVAPRRSRVQRRQALLLD